MKIMTLETAWNLIEEMGWSTTADYKKIAETFYKRLGVKRMNQLHSFVSDRVSQLGAAVNSYEQNSVLPSLEVGSDDGFSDLRYHIVGRGRAAFEKALGNPEEMEKRHKRGRYKESFAYCFMQPDSPRTEAQKGAAFNKLMAEIERLNKRVGTLNDQSSLLHMQMMSLTLLAGTVKRDMESA